MSDGFSLRETVFGRMDYSYVDNFESGVSLRERAMRARTGYPASSFRKLGHRQSDHIPALVGTQLDTHDEWKEDDPDAEYVGWLGWKNWYFPYSDNGGNPITLYPGQVDLIDQGTHWKAITRTHPRSNGSGRIGVEVQSTAKLEQSGTYRVSGLFDNCKWYSFSTNSLRQEELHIYVLQSETGYLKGVTKNTFAWVYHTGGGNATDGNAINAIDQFPEQCPAIPVDYTFEMNTDLPYITFIVRQLSLFYPDPADNHTTETEFKNFKVERVA